MSILFSAMNWRTLARRSFLMHLIVYNGKIQTHMRCPTGALKSAAIRPFLTLVVALDGFLFNMRSLAPLSTQLI